MGLDILENEGISEKGCIEIENWGFSVHFGFKLLFTNYCFNLLFTLYTYVLANILQNGAKFSMQKLV